MILSPPVEHQSPASSAYPEIYIEEANNPLVDDLKSSLSSFASIAQRPEDAEIIICIAYHHKEDVLAMQAMSNMVNSQPGKKIIFLSWFHPVKDLDRYTRLFSPEAETCILMDTARYHILQLPVDYDSIINSIRSLHQNFPQETQEGVAGDA